MRQGKIGAKQCKHVAALDNLIQRGKIRSAKWQPTEVTP